VSIDLLNYGYLYDTGLNKQEIGEAHRNNTITWYGGGPKTVASVNEAVLKAMGLASARASMDRMYIHMTRQATADYNARRESAANRIAWLMSQGMVDEANEVWTQADMQGLWITYDMLKGREDRFTRDYFEREMESIAPALKPTAGQGGYW